MKTALWTMLVAAAALNCTPAIARADWNNGQPGAQDHNNVFSSSEGQAHARGNINGTIVSVDYSGNMIVVAGPGGRQAITLLPTTSIFRDGENAGVSDLTPGMRVTVSISEVNGALIAQIIRIH